MESDSLMGVDDIGKLRTAINSLLDGRQNSWKDVSR